MTSPACAPWLPTQRPATRLFPLADAIRLHPPAFTGTPMPKDEPLAPNPPDGAIIDYQLASASAQPLEITIQDSDGHPVRHFSSADPAPAPDPAKTDAAPEWLLPPPPPAATPGSHRFVWDLHYPAPAALAGLSPPAEGVWAPPGTYTIILKADGQELRQTLRLRPDPRLTLPPGALQSQFTLARAIEAARIACHDAIAKAAAQHLDTLIGAQPDDPAAAANAPPPRIGGLADIATRLEKLAQAVDGADALPTPDAIAGFQLASRALATAQATLK